MGQSDCRMALCHFGVNITYIIVIIIIMTTPEQATIYVTGLTTEEVEIKVKPLGKQTF